MQRCRKRWTWRLSLLAKFSTHNIPYAYNGRLDKDFKWLILAYMDNEIWAPVFAPFSERYEVSTRGRVRRKSNGKLLAQTRSTMQGLPGYMKVTLSLPSVKLSKHVSVHRLVAIAFIAGDTSKDVNHKDLDKTNNLWTNLEWMTHRENIKHGMANSFTWLDRLRVAGMKRRKPVIATESNGIETRFNSIAHAARALGNANKAGNIVHILQIGGACYGRTWRYA